MLGRKSPRTLFVIGGIIASLVLLSFGSASMLIGWQGRQEVRDTLAQENIVGTPDSTIPGQKVDTGAKAKAMADVMREHTLASTNGLTYSEMGKYKTADNNPAGTDDANLAVKDSTGKPVDNPLRQLWVTETALTTALNTSYFAEQVGLFAIVMGAGLFLTGIGFSVLTVGALRRAPAKETDGAQDFTATPVPSGGK